MPNAGLHEQVKDPGVGEQHRAEHGPADGNARSAPVRQRRGAQHRAAHRLAARQGMEGVPQAGLQRFSKGSFTASA
eukprot:6460812-Pyramimonas_sp.AAC.1